MSKIESLSDLFEMVGCHVTYYDLGRHITKITPQQAIQFDRKQQTYPYPFRQHAWLACLLTAQQADNGEVIWFIKLPLDEQGCLNLGTRDHFIKTIVDKILHKGKEAGLSEALEDSPYAFKPDQARMASIHAILGKQLNHSPSEYFEQVTQYIKALPLDTEDTQWQELGIQGIAELAVRANQAPYSDYTMQAIHHAAPEFVISLCHALEHETLAPPLHALIMDKLQQAGSPLIKASYLRALSRQNLDNELLLPLFSLLGSLVTCSDDEIHLIAALAGKCPHWLADNTQLLRIVMEKLAHREDGYIAFKQITAELSQHPETHDPLWQLLRSAHISSTLAQAVSHIFTQTPGRLQ